MDIRGWLRSLGLEKYEASFRKNEIDDTVLPSLTHENLKELGVTAIGHRLKLLAAIAALRIDASPAFADAAITPDTGSAPPQDTAERRQVTVMFSDLVSSTELAARMDPEDFRDIISAYQKSITESVGRFGGVVAKYMGDGVLVYFGYPQAHEDDAERAVRAGLELITVVATLKTRVSLQTRVGIATGIVIVGDLIGSRATHEGEIVGATPKLAARLQSLAEPNTVVIAESTRELLGNLFELQDLGTDELKPIAGLVRAWAALRPSLVEGRFDALHGAGLTALVGREGELDLLLRRWSRTKASDGQMVLLSGEAGIGKSRLTAALLEKLAYEPHTRLRYFCSPQHIDSAFYPIIGQVERAAGLVPGETTQAKLDKLDVLLAQTSTSKQDAALFAEMLSLPNDGRYPALSMDPQQRRQKTLEALTAQVEALSRQNPVLMIFEDAQWSDPTSLETFGHVVERVCSFPVLLIVTFRPEFKPPWIERPYVAAVTINRLARHDVEAMIDGIVGNKFLTPSARHNIVEHTDGIPLFVEEMTKAALDAGREEEAPGSAMTAPFTALAVPPSLQAALIARLDRLGPAKEVAQIGAVIGREFSHTVISAVIHNTEGELQSAVERLMAAGLLFRQGAPPHTTYLFKHALVRDAAYGMLLREQRRAAHARIAETLKNQVSEIAQSQPELLAHHFTQAGKTEAAIQWWRTAGQRSLARSALLEGAEQLKRAHDQIAALPTTPALRGEEIKLQVAFANALALTGDFVAGKEHYDRALAICDPGEHAPLTTRSGRDIRVALLASRSGCMWLLGYPSAARNDFARAIKNARETGQATTFGCMALFQAGFITSLCGDYVAANAHLDELIGLADERGAPYWKALGTAVRGWLFALTGEASDAVRGITMGLTSLRSTGATLYEPQHLQYLAIAYAELGQFGEAWRCIDDALAAIERSKEKWGEAEVHRVAGEIALKSSPEKAQAYFDRALAVARHQQAKSWELRAAMSMARLWRDQGKQDEARELLAPVYGWFTEGFDTRDLKEAKALLDELAT